MKWPSLRTYDRVDPYDSAEAWAGEFEKSYLGIRFIIGFIGMALPLALVWADSQFLAGSADVRGSMSAYYHSPVRDLFVGGLAACGVILISYLWWRWATWDFWLSLAAGVGVLGVATFPTGRHDVEASATSCGEPRKGTTPACVAIQEELGEGRVETFHFVSTGVVVVFFAALCLVFALRDFGYGAAAHARANHDPGGLGVQKSWTAAREQSMMCTLRQVPRTVLYSICLLGVVLGACWALLGPDWLAPKGYTGEFVAFFSFGSAWMVASWDLFVRKSPHIAS